MKLNTVIILISALVIIYFGYKYGIKPKDNSKPKTQDPIDQLFNKFL